MGSPKREEYAFGLGDKDRKSLGCKSIHAVLVCSTEAERFVLALFNTRGRSRKRRLEPRKLVEFIAVLCCLAPGLAML
jgi:hypothetical protein